MTAARASRCAAEQGKFWEMRHAILSNNDKLAGDSFGTFAQDLKMNAAKFKTCLGDASRFQADIQKDMAEGKFARVTGTPSFVVGRTTATGLDGVLMVGAQPYAAFDEQLKELLAAK
jgi:protein-disulfide isomerase